MSSAAVMIGTLRVNFKTMLYELKVLLTCGPQHFMSSSPVQVNHSVEQIFNIKDSVVHVVYLNTVPQRSNSLSNSLSKVADALCH